MTDKMRPPRPAPAPPIDWDALVRRLERTRAPRDQVVSSHPHETAILAARAVVLAQAPPDCGVTGPLLDIVEFRLAQETYGLASSFVSEIVPLKELTPLPGTPPFVRGIMSVRGQIFSVIDLSTFFDLPEQAATGLHWALLVQAGTMRVAILAEAIVGVRALPLGELQAMPPAPPGWRAAYLQGVTSDHLILLDAEKLLTDEALIINDELER